MRIKNNEGLYQSSEEGSGLQYFQNNQSELLLAAGLDTTKQPAQNTMQEGVQP